MNTIPENNSAEALGDGMQSQQAVDDNKDKASIADVYNAATKGFNKIYDRVNYNLNNAKDTLNSATFNAKGVTNEYYAAKKLEVEREQRRELGKVAITDALLNVRGTFTTFQTIEKKWYLAIYPKASPMTPGKDYTAAGELRKEDVDWDDIHHTSLDSLPKDGVPNSFPEYERIVNWKKSSEAPVTGRQGEFARTVFLYPFSTESFLDLSFYVHLTDLFRYRSLEFCLYIEGPHDAEPLLPKATVLDSEFGLPLSRTDLGYVPHVKENKRSLQKIISSYMKKSKYLPGFYAEMSLRRGSIFSPSGGRLHLSLKPNAPMLLNLPEGHRLAALDGLDILVTLMPIAQPSTLYLRTFRSQDMAAPCYPSNLVDCTNLSSVRVEWDQLSTGRATCSGQYRDKVFIGSLNRGPKKTECMLYEFNKYGKQIGRVLTREGNERIIFLFSGHIHTVCCFNSGMIAIVFEKTILAGAGQSASINEKTEWEEPLYLQTHPIGSKLVSGCITHHANMDISFVVDSRNGISVHILDKGDSIRTAYNEGFLSSEIKQLCCYRDRLYLAHNDGKITVINISLILNGELEYITQLSRLIVMHETIITTGISSMVVFSVNAFLGLKNEDDFEKKPKTAVKDVYAMSDNIRFSIGEGHMLLIGGTDEDPSVRLLKPDLTGMREIVCLKGHTKAVTDVFADAAGRFFITASRGDKSILLWDGLTFRCEKQILDVSIGSINIADNLIVVSSINNPFVRFWGLPAPLLKNQKVKGNVDEDHNHDYIIAIRNAYFCQAMLKGNILSPNETLAKVVMKDIDLAEFEQVLWRWNRQYNRYSKPLQSLLNTEITAATPTPTRSKLRRQLEKLRSESKLKTLSDDDGLDDSEGNDDDANTKFFDALITTMKSDKVGLQPKGRNRRHPSNRIFKPQNRAHFSDSDDSDKEEYYLKPKSNGQNIPNASLTSDTEDINSNTEKVDDKSYLPRIYRMNDVYDED